MALLGLLVCTAAVYGLWAAPAGLWATAVAVAVVNLVCVCSSVLVAHRTHSRPRALTACQHVTTALGGFFLFVALAMPG